MLNANDTDMLSDAREAQWSSLTFMGPDAIKLIAPAKVNLFLDVMGRREDGYHEVVNVMHSLALHDIIYMNFDREWQPGDNEDPFSIEVETVVKDSGSIMGPDPTPHFPLGDSANDPARNLAAAAVRKLAHEMPGSADIETGKLSIRIEKHIPAEAGLGGGSSDAAAAMIGAAHFWNIDRNSESVREAARSVGADVPFFLKGGCMVLGGIGDSPIKSIKPMNLPIVLAKPIAGVPTREAYARFDENPSAIPQELLEVAMGADDALHVPLANNLIAAASDIVPEIAEIIAQLESAEGVRHAGSSADVLISGSGSAVFAICDTYNDAMRIASTMQKHGWWSRATTFSSIPAAKVG